MIGISRKENCCTKVVFVRFKSLSESLDHQWPVVVWGLNMPYWRWIVKHFVLLSFLIYFTAFGKLDFLSLLCSAFTFKSPDNSPKDMSPKNFFPTEFSQTECSRTHFVTESSPKDISPNGQFPKRAFARPTIPRLTFPRFAYFASGVKKI